MNARVTAASARKCRLLAPLVALFFEPAVVGANASAAAAAATAVVIVFVHRSPAKGVRV